MNSGKEKGRECFSGPPEPLSHVVPGPANMAPEVSCRDRQHLWLILIPRRYITICYRRRIGTDTHHGEGRCVPGASDANTAPGER